MKVETARFGEITLNDDQVIHMPHGMLGFAQSHRFVIIQNRADSPFFWYQCLDDPDLAFVITSPFNFMPEYHPDINAVINEMSWRIDAKDACKELEIYVVVNIPRGAPEKMTGNFMGPLLINPRCRQAAQVVLYDSGYSHKTRLFVQSADEKGQIKNKTGG